MTYRIAKSQTFPEFEVAVAAHANEMRDWRAHMARVREDEAKGVVGIERHVAYPAPSAHPLVAAAVNENDVADYEVFDDGPTPEQIFMEKKRKLLELVSRAEGDAIGIVIPPGKRRALDMREQDIVAEDLKRAIDLRPGLLAKIASAVGLATTVDVAAAVAKARPAADTKHLAEQNERRVKIDIIQRAAAQAHSDVEDLTAETIDAWKMPDFPK